MSTSGDELEQNIHEGRGRSATQPWEISPRGWWDILLRVNEQQSEDNLSIIAAGVAFFWFLAIFPALAAGVSLFGLVFNTEELQRQMAVLQNVMPQQAFEIVQAQLKALVQQPGGTLSLGIIGGVVMSLWSANKGMKALITAMNIIYEEDETRGFLKLNAFSLLLTFCAVALWLLAVIMVIAIPTIINIFNFSRTFLSGLLFLRWPLIGAFLIFALTLAYRFCPDRKTAKWRWVSWGAGLATLLWLIASILFSTYVANFDSYSKMYGSMGALVILLIWIFLSSYILLLGGELNAEMEHQTRKDSTVGPSRPLGERDAYMADTIGEERSIRNGSDHESPSR